jgi:hypothetical protein
LPDAPSGADAAPGGRAERTPTGAERTPLDLMDLVEGTGALVLDLPAGRVWAVRPELRYPSPGAGRIVLAAAFGAAVATGRLDPARRRVLARPAEPGGRGVLAAIGPGANPTLSDLLSLAVMLEDAQAATLLAETLGAEALAGAARALGYTSAMSGLTDRPPEASATENARALGLLLGPGAPAWAAGMDRLFAGGRYRWRLRGGVLGEADLMAAGGTLPDVVEDTAAWSLPGGGVAVLACALTEVEDPWRAEYLLAEVLWQAQSRTSGGATT